MSHHNELLRYVVIDSDYETETLREISNKDISHKDMSNIFRKERSMKERKEGSIKPMLTPSTFEDIQHAYLTRQVEKENIEAKKEEEGLLEQCQALQSMINLMIKEEAKLKVALRAKQRKINLESKHKAQSIEQVHQMSVIQQCRSPIPMNPNTANTAKKISQWQSVKQKEVDKPKLSQITIKAKQRQNRIAEGKVVKGRWTYQKK